VPRSFLTFLLSLLPKSLLSSWVGRAVHAPLPPPVARRSVALFARWYQINLAEAELPLAHYPTIGALFSRRLKPGVRPLGPGPVHPADTPRHNSRYISSELSRLTAKCLS
jgi:phosphatidylserine decarboxylase